MEGLANMAGPFCIRTMGAALRGLGRRLWCPADTSHKMGQAPDKLCLSGACNALSVGPFVRAPL